MPSPTRTARQIAREHITSEIVRVAREHVRSNGPAQLSLRAVARDVGMVSSAVYRYFASRDDLLTALLIEAYDELGAATEAADSSVENRGDHRARWRAASRAVRGWALEHPGDYALLYGSPVPGYAAPRDTVTPATRVIFVLVGIVIDAHRRTEHAAEAAVENESVARGAGKASARSLESAIAGAMAIAQERGLGANESDAEVTLRTLMAWTTLFGTISFELFGHLVGSIDDYAQYFDEVAARLADDLGL